MITFLAALVFVFFDDTSVATRVSLGVVLGLLLSMVGLLLYLEREGTISNEGSYFRHWQAFLRWARSLWGRRQRGTRVFRLPRWTEKKQSESDMEKHASRANSFDTVSTVVCTNAC